MPLLNAAKVMPSSGSASTGKETAGPSPVLAPQSSRNYGSFRPV
jgi:hypothetical protein